MMSQMTSLQVEAQILIDQIVDQTVSEHDNRTIIGDSYLEMLRNAVMNNERPAKSGSGSKKRVLISAEALDLMVFLQQSWGRNLEYSIVEYYKGLIEERCPIEYWIAFVGALNAIIESIENLLNPVPKWTLNFHCPMCNIKMARRWNVLQELVQVPALEVDVIRGVHCLNCDARWPVGELEHLAVVLGCIPIDLLSSGHRARAVSTDR